MNPEDQLDPGLNPAASFPEPKQWKKGEIVTIKSGSENPRRQVTPGRLLQFDGEKWNVVDGGNTKPEKAVFWFVLSILVVSALLVTICLVILLFPQP